MAAAGYWACQKIHLALGAGACNSEQFGGFKSLTANLHLLWGIKVTALKPPGETLHGSRRWASVLGQRRAWGAGLSGHARVAQSSLAL